jgi:hypothetical protein
MAARLPLDHLVYAVPDLTRAMDDFERRLGVRPAPGGRHEGLGTHNAILPLAGRSYVELIAPDPEGGTPSRARPFGLDSLDAPRLVTWAARSEQIEETVANSRTRGFDPGVVLDLSRASPSGELLRWKLSLRSEPGGDGLIPFVIDWGRTPHPGESHTGLTDCGLDHFSGVHPEPALVTAALEALGAALTIQPGDGPTLKGTISGPAGEMDLTS